MVSPLGAIVILIIDIQNLSFHPCYTIRSNTLTRLSVFSVLVLIMIVLSVSCSSGKGSPVSNQVPQPVGQDTLAAVDNPNSGRAFWGLWDITIDPKTQTASIQESRDLESHINVTAYVSPKVQIINYDPSTRIANVVITITNPSSLIAYDVRGILYTNDQGLLLTNDDGWTDLFDVAGGQSFNPFRAYCRTNPNRQFPAHSQQSEQFLVYVPANPGSIRLGFDASYPGNCLEPYEIKNFTHTPLYESAGSTSDLRVEASDWQNDVNAVRINAQAITGDYYTNFAWIAGESKWGVTIINNTSAVAGKYTCLVLAMSANSSFQSLYDYVTITISPVPCPTDSNNTCSYGELLSLVDTVDGCVDSTDISDWYHIYLPPKGLTSGTISITYDGAEPIVNVNGIDPGGTCPGTSLGSGTTINLAATTLSSLYIQVTTSGGRSNYTLNVNIVPAISLIDCKIFVAKNSSGKWPIWEGTSPAQELTLTHIQNQITWTNNLWSKYGYNLVWDGTVTFMASSYYIVNNDAESTQMHNTYGKPTGKLSLYFVDVVPTGIQTAYCVPVSPRSAHTISSTYTVYSPNVWYWQQAISHEEGHHIGYYFDMYIYDIEGVACGDKYNLPGGYPTYLYSDPTACYAGNLMYYYYEGWTWNRFTLTKGQQDYINTFHYQSPNNFPSH